MLEDECQRLVKRNAYRLKVSFVFTRKYFSNFSLTISHFLQVIDDLSTKNTDLEKQLENLNSFYSERREFQNKIEELENVIENLNKKLGSTSTNTKEKEKAITNINQKLSKMSRTKAMINDCLSEASGSIRAALVTFFVNLGEKN